MTIGEMVSRVVKAMNFEGEILYDRTESDGHLIWQMDNGKFRKYLPDFKFTPFDEGKLSNIYLRANVQSGFMSKLFSK